MNFVGSAKAVQACMAAVHEARAFRYCKQGLQHPCQAIGLAEGTQYGKGPQGTARARTWAQMAGDSSNDSNKTTAVAPSVES